MDNQLPIENERQFPHLTEMQEAFIANYVSNGGKAKRAAIAAGYAEDSAHVTASRLLRNPPIMEAMMQTVALRLGTSAVRAAARLHHLMDSAKSEYVQLEAAKDVLNRVGATAPKKVSVSGAVSITIDLGD